MKVTLLAVGKPKGSMADPIREYEDRIRHYFTFQAIEVKEEPARAGRAPEQVRQAEGERLLARVPAGAQLIALHREGASWSSDGFARHLESLALSAHPGVALVIGGAFGLSSEVLQRAERKLTLSAMTLPHELARLVLVEQLYRAGTILRGEPYHKGARS